MKLTFRSRPTLLFFGISLAAAATGSAGGGVNVTMDGGREVRTCDDVRIKFDFREAARAEVSFTMPGGSPLQVSLPANSGIRVRGADRGDYSITACKAALHAEALDDIRVAPEGSGVAFRGPAKGDWVAFLIVEAPRNAALDLEAKNGPIGVSGIAGSVAARTANGPISLHDCSGSIDAHATNGPISLEGCDGSGEARAVNGPIDFRGDRGTYRLDTQNGPISVELVGDRWGEGSLEARAINGPLSLKLPETYRSGVLVEMRGHGPVSCPSAICRAARRTFDDENRRIEFGDSEPVVRLSTRNGPVSVEPAD